MEDYCGSGKWGGLRRCVRPALGLLVALGWLAGQGCTRHFFRNRADKEVAEVLAEKDNNPVWRIDQYHVYPDTRARFADPTNPDRPPMPPDDPGAYDLSPHPQKPGKAGVLRVEGNGYLELLAAWDTENRATLIPAIAPASAREFGTPASPVTTPPGPGQPPPKPEPVTPGTTPAPATPTPAQAASLAPGEGPLCDYGRDAYLIRLEQAAALGLVNSREYQSRREDLYLAALPVTTERFSFAGQFQALGELIREQTGSKTLSGKHNRWTDSTTLGFSKLFSTGALLLLKFANQTVFELQGDFRHTASISTINLDIVQPFLRGGGQAVTLEPLTQGERNLVYQVRGYARYRKEFFVNIVAGSPVTSSGGTNTSLGAISAAASSAAQSAAFNATAVDTSGGGGFGGGGGFAGNIGLTSVTAGYLPTVLQKGQLENDRQNVIDLQKTFQLFAAIKEGGDVSQLQVDQVESQLLSAQSTVLSADVTYHRQLDQFKEQLGLPTDLPLALDDTPLRPLSSQLRRFDEVFEQFEQVRNEANKFGDPGQVRQLRSRLKALAAAAPLVQGTSFRDEFPKAWATWERLASSPMRDPLGERLTQLRNERREILLKRDELENRGQTLSSADQQRLAALDIAIDLGYFELALRQYETEPWRTQNDPVRRRLVQSQYFRDVINSFALVLGPARNERVEKIRQSWPKLPPVVVEGIDLVQGDIDEALQTAGRTALVNRLDLMNARAQLVDSWRQIAVTANSLLGTFNVKYHMDSSTPPTSNEPLSFGNGRTRHQLILDWELPLVRVAERNAYRTSLITYQRQRRALMLTEDSVLDGVRQEVRQLRQLSENYKIQRRSVELAYFQVENALETFRAPPQPVAGAGAVGGSAAQAAALTQQLLSAQSRLPFAQNSLYTVWIQYQITRMQLFRDLELLPLDSRGVWIDELATLESAVPGPASAPGGVPAANACN